MIKQTYLLIFILSGIWLTGCQDDINPQGNPSLSEGNKIEVSIRTTVPAITIQTKAAAGAEEKQLNHVDVLVFQVEDNKAVFAYRTSHTNDLSGLDYTSDNIYIKTKLKVSSHEEKYRIVFIANLEDEINELLEDEEGTPYEGMEKDELLQKITFIQQAKWTMEDNNFRALPMWGEASETPKIDTHITPGSFGDIHLLRSMARITFRVNIDDNENAEIFKINAVKIYNAREEGLAVPFSGNFDAESHKVTAPSVTGNTTTINENAMTYPVTGNELTGVYVNEAVNQVNGTETDEPLFLIIQASYNGGSPTYYKTGFYTDNKPVDILRNFTYNMIITGVSGPGEEDEESAVNSISGNLTVAMTDWSDAEMKYVVFNGQYYLAVSESEMIIPKAAGTHSLKVKTNYIEGWQARIKEGNWLSGLNPSSSDKKDESEQLFFTVTQNDDIESRYDTITISCGNHLSLDVSIVQITEEGTSLKIQVKNAAGEYVDLEENTLYFHSGHHYEIDPYELKVTWTPTSQNLVVDFNRSFDWDRDKTDLQTIYEGGTALLTIAPARMQIRPENPSDPLKAWFPSEETEIDMRVGGDSSTKQIVSIKKQHYEVYIDRSERYEMDGNTHTFKLYSNSPGWTARFEDIHPDIKDLIEIIGANPPTGGDNVSGKGDMEEAGESIGFRLKVPDDNKGSRNVEVLIRVTYDNLGTNITKDYVFRAYYEDENSDYIAGGDANCYILKPGGNKIHIPVSQANRSAMLGQQIKEGNELTPCFIWTDHPGGYGAKSGETACTVANMRIIGNGPGAIQEVTSGTAMGNAVVGIKNGEEIVWSWHLWISDFDPNNSSSDYYTFRKYQFLDRNLGALSNDPANPESFGLYYQWGRKDPFPSALASGSTSFVTIYDESGEEIKISTMVRGETPYGSGRHYLKEATRNPLMFITSSEWWCTSDFGTYGIESTKFWSENETSDIMNATKGVFDPCPDGWKTVPAATDNASDWYKLFASCTYDKSGHYSNVHNQASDFVDLGNWPHVGAIGNNSATITDTQMGRYWTGNKSGEWDNTAIHFLFSTNPSASHPATSYSSSSALPVRCMRRID